MRKLYIVYLYLSVLSSQNLLLKGQFWSVNQSFEGILENKPSIQSQLGYIPTLSLLKTFSNERTLDLEWAHRLTGNNSYQDTFNSYDRPYRRWIRYSSNNVEARLGLQKITFGPAQILRPLSWFDTINISDPTGQTDGVEALRLRYFPNDILSLWTWGMNSDSDKYSYGFRAELMTVFGDWGITHHRDENVNSYQIGLLPIVASGSNSRFALDYRFDGIIGFWFEGSSILFDKKSYDLATIGADYTLPIFNGILITSETMHINTRSITEATAASYPNINNTYSVIMGSMPIGLLHQAMALIQWDWQRSISNYYLRWGVTYDRLSFNFSLSVNSSIDNGKNYQQYLSKNLEGFGNILDFTIIYNH